LELIDVQVELLVFLERTTDEPHMYNYGK